MALLGINYEAPLHDLVKRSIDHGLVSVVEFIPDRYAYHGLYRELADIVDELGVPCQLHFISNSLGSADFVDNNEVPAFAELINALDPVHYSDHLTCCRAGDIDLRQNIGVPINHTTVELFVDNIRAFRDQVGDSRDFLFENLPSYWDYESSTMAYTEFATTIAERTNSGFLLDLHNIYVDEVNRGWDATAFIDNIPAERIRELHIAGGEYSQDGAYLDSHSQRTPARVFELLEYTLERSSPHSVVLERISYHHKDPDRLLEETWSDLNRLAEITRRYG